MQRPKRGNAAAPASDKEARRRSWKFSQKTCLERFVTHVTNEGNEYEDKYLLKYVPVVKQHLNGLGQNTDLC